MHEMLADIGIWLLLKAFVAVFVLLEARWLWKLFCPYIAKPLEIPRLILCIIVSIMITGPSMVLGFRLIGFIERCCSK